MTQISDKANEAIAQLQACLALTPDLAQHAKAKEQFAALKAQLTTDSPIAAELLELAWNEVIAARRSAAFWEQISDAEKNMSDKVGESLLNLQQNHLRLIQEQ
jgi:predicted metalloprotease with PDZ domain